MAQPIPLELPPRDPRKELLDRLESAPQEHAEALLDAFDLLEELHQAGALQKLRGTVSASDEILNHAVGAAKSSEGTRAPQSADPWPNPQRHQPRPAQVHCGRSERDTG
jgi:hypothetical protein